MADLRPPLPVACAAAAVLVYALAALAHGEPRFPTRSDCVRPARHDGDVAVVFGSLDSTAAAEALRARAEHSGFPGLRIERNACGRVEVVLRGVPTLEVGREVAAEAASVGIRVTLAQGG